MGELKNAIDVAKKLVKNVEPIEGDKKGRLTKARLRKMLDLAVSADLYDEFKLKIKYLVARNTFRGKRELEDFVQGLIKEIDRKSGGDEEKLDFAKLILEYVIMEYYAKGAGLT